MSAVSYQWPRHPTQTVQWCRLLYHINDLGSQPRPFNDAVCCIISMTSAANPERPMMPSAVSYQWPRQPTQNVQWCRLLYHINDLGSQPRPFNDAVRSIISMTYTANPDHSMMPSALSYQWHRQKTQSVQWCRLLYHINDLDSQPRAFNDGVCCVISMTSASLIAPDKDRQPYNHIWLILAKTCLNPLHFSRIETVF